MLVASITRQLNRTAANLQKYQTLRILMKDSVTNSNSHNRNNIFGDTINNQCRSKVKYLQRLRNLEHNHSYHCQGRNTLTHKVQFGFADGFNFDANKDYYSILGVNKEASSGQVKRAYYALAKEFHPDVNKGSNMNTGKFKEINEAYNVLSDDNLRKNYDSARVFRGFQNYMDPSQNGFKSRQDYEQYVNQLSPEERQEIRRRIRTVFYSIGGFILFFIIFSRSPSMYYTIVNGQLVPYASQMMSAPHDPMAFDPYSQSSLAGAGDPRYQHNQSPLDGDPRYQQQSRPHSTYSTYSTYNNSPTHLSGGNNGYPQSSYPQQSYNQHPYTSARSNMPPPSPTPYNSGPSIDNTYSSFTPSYIPTPNINRPTSRNQSDL